MISSLEYSEPNVLNVKEQNPSHQTEWKRIVTDLTSLGGVIRSPPSSPLSISWSSSASSTDNEPCVPPKPFIHHHVVTKLNFDSCVPRNTVSPHVRAKVSRSVINCVSNSLEENCKPSHEHTEQSKTPIASQGHFCSSSQEHKSLQENLKQCKSENVPYDASQDFFYGITQEENRKPPSEYIEQNKSQHSAQIASQDNICNISPNKSCNVNVKQLDKEIIGDPQCHREENKDLTVCSPVPISSQLSPIIVRDKRVHSASCKKRSTNETSMYVCNTKALLQEFSKSPLLGTSDKEKALKASAIRKQSRKTISPSKQADSNSCAFSSSPILQRKRRRRLTFENTSKNSREKCPSEHHIINVNLPADDDSTENTGELRANVHLQVDVENVNFINKKWSADSLVTESQVDKPTSPVLLPAKSKTENVNFINKKWSADLLVTESQVDKPTSPVLIPAKSKTKKRKCRRRIKVCKTLGVCTNTENAEQDSSHINRSLIHIELDNVPKMVLQTPDKEVKERNVLRDISGSYAFSPSRKEVTSAVSLKKTPENLKLKQSINRKHVRRKIIYVEGIKKLSPENISLVNSDIHEEHIILKNQVISPEVKMFSSTLVGATSANEPNLVLEDSVSLKKDTIGKSNLIASGQFWQDGQKTEKECTHGGVAESVRDGVIKMPKTTENSSCSPACLVLNESTSLVKQNNGVISITVNSVKNKQLISDPLAPKMALGEQQFISHDSIPAKPAFSIARDLSKKHDRLPHFEVKDCIKRRINTPKPYILTDREEELVKFSFAKAPSSTLAITSATRFKERLKWIREQKSKNMDQSCFIEHETQKSFTQKVAIQTNDSITHLKNEMNMLDRFKKFCPLNKTETKHLQEENRGGKNAAQETNGEGQEESLLNPTLSELNIEDASSQECDSIKIFDRKEEEQLPSQEISEKSSCSTNVSPVAQYDNISDCVTPTRISSASGEEMVPYCDSSKKKRRPRLNKDGLAERLQKLLLRQHSSTRIWQHELSRGSTHWRKTSVTLTVTSIKREYSHLLLQGALYPSDVSEEKIIDENMISTQLIVVLDPVCAPQQVKVDSRIKIYPPWQTLSITTFDITLILGVTCVEELPSQQKSKSVPLKPLKEEIVYTANCSCLKLEPSAQRKCQFHFPLGGTEIFSHLMPHTEYIKGSLFCSTKSEPHPWHGTITDIVTRHGCLLTGSVWLQLRISRVFHYIDRASKKDVWSLLGRDNIGEYCEVILSCPPTEMDVINCWTDVTTQHVIGHLHRFTGFMLTDRRHKSRHQDLWTVLKEVQAQLREVTKKTNSETASTIAQEENDKELDDHKDMKALKSADSMTIDKQLGEENSQLFFYVLSPCAQNWQMKCVSEEMISEWPKMHTCSLYDILQQRDDGLSRHSCLVRLLYTAAENLYVTDVSLGQETLPTYVTISVKPSCFLPADVMEGKTKAVFLQDLLNDQGKLCVDKYGWIVSLKDMETKIRCLDYEESLKSEIEKLNVTIPKLDFNSSVKHLVTLTGAVIGVDEETAFAWPVCAKCENDLLLEVRPNEYVCQQCKKKVRTNQKMTLEVFISCTWLPLSSSIKVKLLQESILNLLPPNENNDEGYSLIAVLGQEIGPLTCLVVSARNQNFVLEEIKIL